MKKFLTLVLALVMVLAIAAPAMAFTSVQNSEEPYEVDVYLVEYDNDDFFGITSLPASDRGYAKNEIVAAIGEVYVPKGMDPVDDGYVRFAVSGENVSFNVMDNAAPLKASSNLGPVGPFQPATAGTWADGGFYELFNNTTFAAAATKAATFKVLFFAKVLDDDASITVALRTLAPEWNTAVTGAAVSGLDVGDYIVVRSNPDADGNRTYTIYEDKSSGNDVERFTIGVNKDFESKFLKIEFNDHDWEVIDGINGLVFANELAVVLSDPKNDTYEDIMDIMEDHFEDEFGFDFALLGGVVDNDFFEDFLGSDDIEATVDIAPWTAYVTVPDNIVVDPPKTGDAASILGFVMIVLAAAAVVAVRKVRA